MSEKTIEINQEIEVRLTEETIKYHNRYKKWKEIGLIPYICKRECEYDFIEDCLREGFCQNVDLSESEEIRMILIFSDLMEEK